jgi:hypothetical protein
MSPQVDAILQQIESLNEADRILLEQKLQELTELHLQRDARAIARQQGIDQRTIEDAVENLCYVS